MKFPYQKEEPRIFGEIYRPVVRFEIETEFGWIPVLAYIDSGADITLLPMSFVKVLGIKIEEKAITEIRGIRDAKVPVVIKNVRMRIGKSVFDAKIAIALMEEVLICWEGKLYSIQFFRFVLSRRRKWYTLIL